MSLGWTRRARAQGGGTAGEEQEGDELPEPDVCLFGGNGMMGPETVAKQRDAGYTLRVTDIGSANMDPDQVSR